MHQIKIYSAGGADYFPLRGSEQAAGFDVFNIGPPLTINPGESKMISTGIKLELPNNIECQVRPRSGLATKHHIIIPNSPGTVDQDFKGEIIVCLFNLGTTLYNVAAGERIAQLVFNEVITDIPGKSCTEQELSTSKRGEKGFGSSGK